MQIWEDCGRPKRFHLVELGPGRGTLMSDMLRAARVSPDFLDAADIHLVEISPALREMQRASLAAYLIEWHTDCAQVPPDAPLFVVANEFFDALPVRQYVRTKMGWRERLIGLDHGAFHFVTGDQAADSMMPDHLRAAPEGSVFERCDTARLACAHICMRIIACGGAALIIDYGHLHSGFADTFQAVKAHAYADPLTSPGEADLTCHVDFSALAKAAAPQGARISGPTAQGTFLTALGIRERAERLKRHTPSHAAMIESGVERLVSDAQMGSLFKVLGLSSPGAPPLPGFAC